MFGNSENGCEATKQKAFITGVKYVAHRMKLLPTNKHDIVYNKDHITLSPLMNL